MSKEEITIIDGVPAGNSQTYTHEFRSSGEISGAQIHTYLGQEFALEYRMYVRKGSAGQTVNLYEPLGKEYVAGNGESFDVDCRVEIEQGDELVVKVENKASNYSYDANAWVTFDRHTLTDRLTDALRNLM